MGKETPFDENTLQEKKENLNFYEKRKFELKKIVFERGIEEWAKQSRITSAYPEEEIQRKMAELRKDVSTYAYKDIDRMTVRIRKDHQTNRFILYGYEIEGKWLECGNKLEWLKSHLYLSFKHPEIGPKIKEYLRNL